MNGVTFEWDLTKAVANLRKHGVPFEEAVSVFRDVLARILDDPDHSLSESREIIVGRSDKERLLLVAFVERNDRIRIISARRATPSERKDYEEGHEH